MPLPRYMPKSIGHRPPPILQLRSDFPALGTGIQRPLTPSLREVLLRDVTELLNSPPLPPSSCPSHSAPMDFALSTYMNHAGIRLRETRPSSLAEKAPSAPDKDKWLPFFPKTKKVTRLLLCPCTPHLLSLTLFLLDIEPVRTPA